MKTTNNTILITGGSAGMGLEIARLFVQLGNKVIITGRNKERLQEAANQLQDVTAIQSDVTSAQDLDLLVERLTKDFPALNMVINNAGKVSVYNLADRGANAADKALDEMMTNYVSIVRLNEKLLPLLSRQQEAAIVNVSSIVAFVPSAIIPTYAASKAALHSYTASLRMKLQQVGSIKVFELMPPLVDTSFSQEIGGSKGIHPAIVAKDLIDAIENNVFEVRVGLTEQIYQLSLSSPADAFAAMNAA